MGNSPGSLCTLTKPQDPSVPDRGGSKKQQGEILLLALAHWRDCIYYTTKRITCVGPEVALRRRAAIVLAWLDVPLVDLHVSCDYSGT